MRLISLFSIALLLSFAVVRPAAAQTSTADRTACDSLAAECARLGASADSAVRQLERAASDLAKAVEQTVRATANNPELRVSALKLAAGALAVTQQTLLQNADVLQRLLADAARQIALAQAGLESRIETTPKKP